MNVSSEPTILGKFYRTAWRFQQTFEISARSAGLCAASTVEAVPKITEGKVVVDRIAMEPRRLRAFLSEHQLPPAIEHGTCISASTTDGVRSLLSVVLSEWVDFLFVPSPKPFVLYADHDRYVTVLANSRSNLNKIAGPLTTAGFKHAVGYVLSR
jgi:hypothetical protein